MIDREAIERENKRLATRRAVVEDVNLNVARALDKALFAKLVAGDWIEHHQNVLIIGQPVRSATRLAAITALSFTTACHACSMPWC
jgi:IstB-like ATP binding protein